MSTGQEAVAVLFDWEGNRRSGFALAMHHRLWYIQLRAQRPKKGKEEYLYSAFLAKVVHSKRSGMDHTVLPANNNMPAFPS